MPLKTFAKRLYLLIDSGPYLAIAANSQQWQAGAAKPVSKHIQSRSYKKKGLRTRPRMRQNHSSKLRLYIWIGIVAIRLISTGNQIGLAIVRLRFPSTSFNKIRPTGKLEINRFHQFRTRRMEKHGMHGALFQKKTASNM